jgi:hypothetical protein
MPLPQHGLRSQQQEQRARGNAQENNAIVCQDLQIDADLAAVQDTEDAVIGQY